jgi:hypothetical protein
MTSLATDDFNRANCGLGANWTDIDAGYSIVSNETITRTALKYRTENILSLSEAFFQ